MENNNNSQPSQRAAWAAPKLTMFGGMTALTASGTGVQTENKGQDDLNNRGKKP